MKRRMLITVIALALVCAVAGAGTMAYFTSSATSKGSSFTAGTLKLGSTAGTEGTFDEIKLNKLEPGVEVVNTTELKNVGSLPLTLYRLAAEAITPSKLPQVKLVSFIPTIYRMEDLVNVVVDMGFDTNNDDVYDTYEHVYTGSLFDMRAVNGGFFDPIKSVPKDKKIQLRIAATLSPIADNYWQDANVGCKFTVYSRQDAITDSGNPEGREFTLAQDGDFKITGWNTSIAAPNKQAKFRFTWGNLGLVGADVVRVEIKHEKGTPDLGITESRWYVWIFQGTEQIVVPNELAGLVVMDWDTKTLSINHQAFDSSWKGFEVKFEVGTAQIGLPDTFAAAKTTPYMYWTLNRP